MTNSSKENKTGIVSKKRVNDFGEVYTPDFIVNDMLDLVDKEVNKEIKRAKKEDGAEDDSKYIHMYLEKTYLEPSCGNGQFLIRILDRKIGKVNSLPESEKELGLIKAVASIYGVDIQLDNVQESRNRMMRLIRDGEAETFNPEGKERPKKFNKLNFEPTYKTLKAVEKILEANIVWGNTLTKKSLEFGRGDDDALWFCEYDFEGENVTVSRSGLGNDACKEKLFTCSYLELAEQSFDVVVEEDEEEGLDF